MNLPYGRGGEGTGSVEQIFTGLNVKSNLHRLFLTRKLMQFLAHFELHQVSNMFEILAISQQQNRRWFTCTI